MATSSTYALAYVIRKVNGLMRQKKVPLSLKEKLKPNFIMEKDNFASSLPKT
jgi:hypothetical protein